MMVNSRKGEGPIGDRVFQFSFILPPFNSISYLFLPQQEVTLVQVYNGTKLSFPAFIFDKGETVESLHFHTYSKIIYAYGSQVT